VLSQLNREVERRNDKRPIMSDLRGSGALEERPRMIVSPFRSSYYYDQPKIDIDYDCVVPPRERGRDRVDRPRPLDGRAGAVMSVKAVAAVVQGVNDAAFAAVRAAFSAYREADIQVEKSEKRLEAARGAREIRKRELGLALAEVRKLIPITGPKAKAWGTFLDKEGISQSWAWKLMEDVGYRSGGSEAGFHSSRNETAPHPADMPDQLPLGGVPPVHRKPFGRVLDMQLYLGRWQDVLSPAEVGQVDALITDPPYSERVHKSKPTRNDGVDEEGLTPNYEPWSRADVEQFVEHWSPRTRGWMLCLCDDEMIPWYRAAYERLGRVSFAPVPCVINGMSVRTRGDGPSSWAVYAMVARPTGAEFANWGTLPGAYMGSRESGAKSGRGKPRWLTDAFVKDYTRGNDLVCDPLAGYGGTLISALLLNRRALGAEMDQQAVDEAFVRANATQQQPEGVANPQEAIPT
jgi:hypothetical protein